MNQALGIGGFPHFAAHPYGWMQALGFRMEKLPLSRITAAGLLMGTALRLLGKDICVSTAVGLERNREVLIKPYCPPYYSSMTEAVSAFRIRLETEGGKAADPISFLAAEAGICSESSLGHARGTTRFAVGTWSVKDMQWSIEHLEAEFAEWR